MPPSRPLVRAPEFAASEWLNTAQPLRMAGLRGRVVVVDIWDFTCLNCLRTLPYLTAWHRAYRGLGVEFVGVHTPEFEFARDPRQVAAAAARHAIEYPLLLDNDQKNWDAFANRYWPCLYLIDAQGYIRYQHAGEGGYEETESALAELVREAGLARDEVVTLPRPLGALRAEDQPGAVCLRATPELHTGYHQGALGNPEGYLPRSLPMLYRLPASPDRHEGYFYVEGTWSAGQAHLALSGQRGALVLPYRAASANAVLAVSPDPVDLRLDLKPPITLRVMQDGAPLDALSAGEDIILRDGQSWLPVDTPRMYQIARNLDGARHELRLEVPADDRTVNGFTVHSFTVYAFSFSTCVVPVPQR